MPSPIARRFALQDEPRGTGDALAAALAVVPATATEILVLSGDVPLVTGADLDAILEARREDDAAIALASVYRRRPGRARPGGPWRVRHRRADRRGDAMPRPTSWRATRSTRGSTPSMPPGCAAGSTALTPSAATGELYLTDLVRLAREDGRLVSAVAFEDDGRLRRHQRPLAAGGRGVDAAGPPQRGAHARRRHDARPVDRLSRLDGRARRGRRPRAERHPARRPRPSAPGASSAPAASSSTRRSARGVRVWASVVESSTVEDEATIGPFSHLRPGTRRRPRCRGRQLRRAQEHAASGPARASTT